MRTFARRCPALALALVLCLPGVALARSTQRTLFEAPRELLGGDPALRQATLDRIQALGVDEVRIVMYWKDVAPRPASREVPGFHEVDPAAYDWGAYGAAVDAIAHRGMRVLLTVSGPVPVWATRDRRDDRTRPSAQHFGRFMQAVGRRFGGEVSAVSVWNEPNHPRFLLPQMTHRDHAESGRLYRKLFQAADRGMRAAGRGDVPLLMGETAPRGTGRDVAPLAFLRRALCLDRQYHRRSACHRLPADGYAHHAYTTKAGVGFRPPQRDDVTIGVLGRLNHALALAAKAGAVRRGLPIELTEFGIQSKPDPLAGVSFTAQAEQRSLAEKIAYDNPRVRLFSQYLMRDDLPRPGNRLGRYSGFESGLLRSDGRPKRAYDAFALPLVVTRAGRHRTRLWGLVRPARGATSVAIEERARHGHRWHALKHDRTNARGVWTTRTRYVPGRRYRVRWAGEDGREITGPPTRMVDLPSGGG
jgi:hypothetical protein